jgi:hypothetical protein
MSIGSHGNRDLMGMFGTNRFIEIDLYVTAWLS